MKKLTPLFVLSLAILTTVHTLSKPPIKCQWSVKTDLPEKQPLYIKPRGENFDIRDFWLPDRNGIVTVPENENVLFACPGDKNVIEMLNVSQVILTCTTNNQFQFGFNKYNFTGLTCKDTVKTSILRYTGVCPSTRTPGGTILKLGFQISDKYYGLIRLCFDIAKSNLIYSEILHVPTINYAQNTTLSFIQGTSSYYPKNISVGTLYSLESQIKSLSEMIGSELSRNYIKSDYQLIPATLTSKFDFVYGTHQKLTSWFFNTIPMWKNVQMGNWKALKLSIRRYASTYKNDLKIISGTHSINSFPDSSGLQIPFYLGHNINGTNILKVPLAIWTIVYDPKLKRGVSFAILNNPHQALARNGFHVCKNICEKINWLDSSWDPNNREKGLAFCCEVSDLSKNIPEMPTLPIEGLIGYSRVTTTPRPRRIVISTGNKKPNPISAVISHAINKKLNKPRG